MRVTSDSYRKDMQSGFRNVWQPSLRLGLLDESMQSYNRVIMVDHEVIGLRTHLDSVTDIGANRYDVATLEENVTTASGSAIFIDENYEYSKKWGGVVSSQCDYLQVRIEHNRWMNYPTSMTLTFVDNAPKRVIVRLLDSYGLGGDVKCQVEGINDNPEQMFIVVEDLFVANSDLTTSGRFYIDIEVVETHDPTRLVKLVEVGMGTFVEFPHDEILSNQGSITDSSNLISLSLPQTTMNIVIDNEGDKYTNTVFNKLSKGQCGILTISYTCFDGTIDNITYPVLQLDDFSVTEKDMTLKFVDYLRYETREVTTCKGNEAGASNLDWYMSSVYDKFYTPGFKVVYDERIGQYGISRYFGNDDTKRPAKDFIKLLAGYCGCTMRNSGKSVVIDKIPVQNPHFPITTESPYAMYGTSTDGFLNELPTSMALWEENRVLANGNSSFYKNDNQMFISKEISDEYGHFVKDIKIKVINIEYEADNIVIKFNPESIPRNITIETHWIEQLPSTSNDWIGDTIVITGNTNSEVVIKQELHDFEYAYITFNDLVEGNRRLEVYGFNVGRQVYSLPSELLIKQPLQTPEDPVRLMRIVNYRTDGSGGIEFDGESFELCNETGVDLIYDHTIVLEKSSFDYGIGKTLKDYYTNNVVYSVEFVGDPTLEVSDLVEIDTYKGKIILELEEVSTTFSNGGIRGTMKGKEYKNG